METITTPLEAYNRFKHSTLDTHDQALVTRIDEIAKTSYRVHGKTELIELNSELASLGYALVGLVGRLNEQAHILKRRVSLEIQQETEKRKEGLKRSEVTGISTEVKLEYAERTAEVSMLETIHDEMSRRLGRIDTIHSAISHKIFDAKQREEYEKNNRQK